MRTSLEAPGHVDDRPGARTEGIPPKDEGEPVNTARSGEKLHSVQVFLATLAAGLIAVALLLAVGGVTLPPQGGTQSPAPERSEGNEGDPQAPGSAQPPNPVREGQRMPGVPEKPVTQWARFETPKGANKDRQLGYAPSGTPSVEFRDGLGALEAYAAQSLLWRNCDQDMATCATMLVPLDWEKPEGPALEIAVRRYAGKDGSLGPLFVNPGGPGQAGQDFAGYLSDRGWEDYDIVGWDPRGTGASTAVRCGTTEQTDAVFDLDQSPDDEAETLALREGYVDFAQQCRDASGALLDHLSTIDSVRDLDLLRHLLGAEKLNYVGVSYGTFVGAVYAELFPHSVGRLVLDSAVDIDIDEVADVEGTVEFEASTSQVAGFELALRNWATWCSENEDCVFRGSTEEIMTQMDEWLQHLDQNPIVVGARRLTQTHAATGIASYLYEDERSYPLLSQSIAEAKDNGKGRGLLRAADSLNGRSSQGFTTSAFAFPATLCVDWYDVGMAAAPALWRSSFPAAPVMAPNMGMNYVCEAWTADSVPPMRITAAGAAPILVVGTTGDSATPFEHARTMARQLESGRLLTLKGAGHGAITSDNSCLRSAIDGYLLDGVLPPEDTVCS